MGLEVRLHVEDRKLVALLDTKKLAKRGVGVDLVLVIELVLLDIGRDRLRNLAAAHKVVLATAKKD